MIKPQREYTRTEFWALIISAFIWLIDKRYGTDLLTLIGPGELSAAKVQVAEIATKWTKISGGNPDLAIYVGIIIYVGRKVEKMVNRIWEKSP